VLQRRHTEKAIVEDLIFVVVNGNVLRVVVGRCEERVPFVWRFEAVVQDDGRVTDLTDLAVTIAIELFGDVKAQAVVKSGLVEKLNANNDILVAGLCILLRDRFEHSQRSLHVISGLPLRAIHSLSRVVVAILASRCTMEVDDNLQAQTPGPVDSSIDVYVGASHIRRVRRVVRPVAHGDAYHVETRLFDLVEVLPGHPRVPVLSKHTRCRISAQLLTKRVLINDILLWPILVCCIEN